MKPFVGYDGEDRNGVRAEVWVQTGTAQITEINPPGSWTNPDGGKWDPATSSSKPGNVEVKVTSDVLRKGIRGWMSTSDPIYPEVVKAFALGNEVEYRYEWQRKAGVDRTTPVKELRGYDEQTGRANMDKSRDNGKQLFVGINGMLTKEAVTDPAEDEAGGRISAIGQDRSKAKGGGSGATLDVEAALTALATARAAGMDEGVVNAAAALALTAGATAKQVNEAGVSEQAPTQRREAARAHAKEATPYTAFNTDGRLNLGNSAVQAAFGAERFAHGILAADRQAAFEKHNAAVAAGEVEGDLLDAPEPVGFGQSLAMAKVFLDLADRVQVGAYGGGRPDRMSSSHTRARSLVYQAIEGTHPVPFGGDAEAKKAWAEALVAECVGQFQALAAIAFPVEAQSAPAQQRPQREQAPQREQGPAPQREQAPAPQAPQGAAPEQQVEQQAPAAQVGQQSAPPKPPVEGEEGFIAPTSEMVVRFGTLSNSAGFTPGPESPVVAYLTKKFGVGIARKVHGPALDALVGWYEQKGDDAGRTFRGHVLREVGEVGEGEPERASA